MPRAAPPSFDRLLLRHVFVVTADPSDVEMVLVDGRVVVWQGQLCTADELELMRQHKAATEALLERRREFVTALEG